MTATTAMEAMERALLRSRCDLDDAEEVEISVTDDCSGEQPAAVRGNNQHSSTNSPPSSTTSPPVAMAIMTEGQEGPQQASPMEPMAAMGLLNLFANGYGGFGPLPLHRHHNTETPPMGTGGVGIDAAPVKRRRRMIGSLDNTLDGLVAKRAADEVPVTVGKRYQTEVEAIELPDDEVEIRRMEADPDVSTRQCSVCGYQGKWVSEMIRHKRVHTHERPFKCKFCNRTSKWKADLIRHVAKTHGIRVVSKYSRSKAFEAVGGAGGGGGSRPSGGSCGSGSDKSAKSGSPHYHSTSNSSSSSSPTTLGTSPNRLHHSSSSVIRKVDNSQPEQSNASNTVLYRCVICLFEAGGGSGGCGDQHSTASSSPLALMRAHLRNVHNLPPLQCIQCATHFDDIDAASRHCSERSPGGGVCSPLAIKLNFSMAGPPANSGGNDCGNADEPLRIDVGGAQLAKPQAQPSQQQFVPPLAGFSYAALLAAVMQREQLKSQFLAGGFGGGAPPSMAPSAAMANLWAASSLGGLFNGGGAGGNGGIGAIPQLPQTAMGMPAWLNGWQQQLALASAAAAMAARHQQLQQGAGKE